ncbi:hypothetical protein Tco_0494143 [Tanacetum coccineum]
MLIRMTLKIQMKLVSKKSLSQDLYMNRYGKDGPEDELKKYFGNIEVICLKNLIVTDSLWSELGQQGS